MDIHDHHPKIMVVDDDAGMRLTLEGIIEDEGFDVIGVEDGFQAIEQAKESYFDLIPILFISSVVRIWEVEPKRALSSPILSVASSVVCQPSAAVAGDLLPLFSPVGKGRPPLQPPRGLPRIPFLQDLVPASRLVEISAQSLPN